MELATKDKVLIAYSGALVLLMGGYLIHTAMGTRKYQREMIDVADQHYAAVRAAIAKGRAVAVVPEDIARASSGAVETRTRPQGPVSHGPTITDPSPAPSGSGIPPAPPAAAEAAPIKNPDPADLGIPNGGFRPTELPE